MKSRLLIFLTIVLMLVVLAALNAASYVRVEQEADSEFAPDRSTQNAGATGTRAFYEFLQQSGYKVARWGQTPAALTDESAAQSATFVIVGRLRRELEKDEASALLRWVARGGRLVIVDRRPDASLLPVAGSWRVTSETVEYPNPQTRPEDTASMTDKVPPLAPAQPTLLTRDVEQVTRSRFAGRLHIYPVAEKTGTGFGKGTGVGPPSPPRVIKAAPASTPQNAPNDNEDADDEDDDEPPPPPPPAQATPTPKSTPTPTGRVTIGNTVANAESKSTDAPVEHFADGRKGDGALLVDYAYGRGRIVILSDPFIVSNGGINLSDNLMLATNVVSNGASSSSHSESNNSGLIFFDEYHQGYGSSQHQALAYFAGTPVLWIFAQCALVLLAVLWTRGRRFARPLPAPHVDRRSKLEFVASMAELQQRARAYDLAIENVYGRTRRALARYGGTQGNAPYADIAARVAARSGRDPAPLAQLMRECEDAMAGAPTSARRALALVTQLRELERDLGIRMRAREIKQAEAR